MCLITKWKNSKIAGHDISVFKVVSDDEELYTLPRKVVIPSDGRFIAEGTHILTESLYDSFFLHRRYIVEEGYIHCYTSMGSALLDPWIQTNIGRIVTATIKKGTDYFLSADRSQICAKEILIDMPKHNKL